MTIQPGDRVLDYSDARPTPSALKANGVPLVIRYTAGAATDPNHPSHALNTHKLITKPEFEALIKSGRDVLITDEWYEGRIEEGRAAGLADGKAAAALLREIGYAKGASVYVAYDKPPSWLKRFRVRRYLRGWHVGAGRDYVPDVYGGTKAIKWLRRPSTIYQIRYGWRAAAGSWSNDGLPWQPDTSTPEKRAELVARAVKATPVHLWQDGNAWPKLGSNDEDLVLRTPFGSHRQTLAARKPPAPTPPPPPPPPAPTTADELVSPKGAKLTLDDAGVLHVTDATGKTRTI